MSPHGGGNDGAAVLLVVIILQLPGCIGLFSRIHRYNEIAF